MCYVKWSTERDKSLYANQMKMNEMWKSLKYKYKQDECKLLKK